MKARVKSTGVLVDVIPQLNINPQHSNDYLYVCDNMVYRECELDFSAIDWEQRRYELAKAAMQGFCSNSHEQVMNASLNMTVEWSLGFADALIKKLKGENKIMTEEFVTLKTAKMLKEKGMFTDIEFPPQSVAQKWLRETKNIHICVYNCACGYGYEISKADNGTHITSSVYEGPNDGGKWDVYEDALEAVLQEALKLI